MATITAKDLSKDFPRSPYEELGGMPWLPRIIDKVRAFNAGTMGDYTPYPCGGDQRFLGTLGLDADAFKAEAAAGKSDEELLAWVEAHRVADWAEKIAAYRKHQATAIADGEMKAYLDGYKAEIAKAKPDADMSKAINFATAICIEEGHPIPA